MSTDTTSDVIDGETLTWRDRAILRAVAGGGAELVFGAEPDLIIDGRCCCDQSAAHRLGPCRPHRPARHRRPSASAWLRA
jgi:hypothetical protein